ncbi:MAG: DUF4258 domain-containing protein [Myxococcota bacterium]
MWWLVACGSFDIPLDPEVIETPEAPASAVEPWRGRRLTLTRHGRCRMGCRQFDRAEVEQILREGRRIPERTRLDGRCPSHALEGTTRDGQRARMVFAACATETRLVTAIDLGTEWPCACE